MKTNWVYSPAYSIRRVPSMRRRRGLAAAIIYPPPSGRPQSGLERRLAMWFLMVLVWGTAATTLGTPTVPLVGKHAAGLVWIAQAAIAALALAFSTRRKVVFPIVVWLPWLLWIILRCDFSNFFCVQRTLMLWAGPIVGLCASAVVSDERQLSWLIGNLRTIVVISVTIFVLMLLHCLPGGIAFYGSSYITLCLAASALAPQVMAGNRRDLILWLCCLAICTHAAFRITIATCIMTLPLTPARLGWKRRLMAIAAVGVLGLAVLSTPQVRGKMLNYSGHDSLRDLARNPGDTYSSGRFYMWSQYVTKAWERPLLGHGGCTSLPFGLEIAGWDHPHCEFIRVFFEYGFIGIILLAIPSLHTLVFTFRRTRTAPSAILRNAWAVSCGGFIAMGMLAVTDNVILYIAFFGCLLFGIFGATCGASALEERVQRVAPAPGTREPSFRPGPRIHPERGWGSLP